jgi:hypothetical protein
MKQCDALESTHFRRSRLPKEPFKLGVTARRRAGW